MAAYAALVSLLNTIHDITNHPRLSTSLHKKDIHPLVEKTNVLLDFIEGNNTYGRGSKELQDLERQIASAAHTAQDLIESHIVDQIHAQTSEPSLACSLDLQKTIQDMDAIIEKTTEVKGKREENSTPVATVAGPLMQSGESAMVGLDAELEKLLGELTGYQSNRHIISIVGMGGSGKTTLAKNVYENLLIKELFQHRAWATISQQYDAKEVLSKLLGGSSSGTLDDLGLQLHKTLFGRKYLIIIDDIWSVEAWDEVKHFFPDNNNGSRILLTTRLANVAKECGSSLFEMNLLDEENSWKLFCEKAFQGEDCPPELRDMGEKIVKSCKGLALSIVVIGGLLLKSPRTLEYWKGVVEHFKLIPDSKEKQESIDVLSLSYNHLPPHLKPCFLFMCVFKEDSKIHVSTIIRLWVAEGLIKPIGSRVLEEIAEGFIKDLIDRNLILGYKSYENRDFESCGIHDLLRELCIKLAEQEGFFQMFDDTTRGIVHRVVEDVQFGRAKVTLPGLRSIMTLGHVEDPTKNKLLRVVKENVFRSKVVDYSGNFNLRYLTWVNIDNPSDDIPWEIPSYVSFMWNLQSLIIETNILIIAPIEFWRMQQLRHVECCKLFIPSPPLSNVQDGSLILDNLQAFKVIVNLRLCEEVCKIISNIKELHLHYNEDLKGYDDSLIESLCNLDRLHKLDLLYLKGSSEWLLLDRELNMKWINSFPRSLKKLSLSLVKLDWGDMTIVGSLPQLEVLIMEDISTYTGEQRWSPVEGQFQQLKYFHICNCELELWDVEESHFPVLEQLHLWYIKYLEEIPLSIGDIPTLQLINVSLCSHSAAISAIRINEDQLDNGGQLQVEVEVFEDDMEIFNQILETHGLTINNIDFI